MKHIDRQNLNNEWNTIKHSTHATKKNWLKKVIKEWKKDNAKL